MCTWYNIVDYNHYIYFLKYLNKKNIFKICVGIVQMVIEITDIEDAETWEGNIKKIFINIIVNWINRYNMDSNTFSTNTWRRMLLDVNSQGKRNFNLKHLKQKFNKLHATHHGFFDLLKYIGFGWDAETNTMYALRAIWQNYIWVKTTYKIIIF